MKRVLQGAVLGVACLAVAVAFGDETGKGTLSDEQFVMKASAAGLAEVNLANVALKQATDPTVKAFARHMLNDHSKANTELIALANKKGLRVAPTMDEKHQQLEARLLKLSGSDFDREYMHSQVQDHKMVLSMFEHEAKDGKDADIKKWAEKTLPTLREHMKEAQSDFDKFKAGKEKGRSTDTKKE